MGYLSLWQILLPVQDQSFYAPRKHIIPGVYRLLTKLCASLCMTVTYPLHRIPIARSRVIATIDPVRRAIRTQIGR
jgi:hypothetical protein